MIIEKITRLAKRKWAHDENISENGLITRGFAKWNLVQKQRKATNWVSLSLSLRIEMWFGWGLISKRAIEVNFRWSKKLRSMVKCGQIDQSKVAQRGQITFKSNLPSSKGSKESKTGQIYSKFLHKDEKIGTSNFALYRRLKKGSLFELETAIKSKVQATSDWSK